ncbi:MAG TPA: DUF1254 domain-containing protein [Syntrophorhabdales bacterium]|nr:DUF1254 domain-containing protein [Syntrophorhabdales bacterium]
MKNGKWLLIFLVAFLVAIHVGAAWADDESLETGIDAYLCAYPLVLMDATRLSVEKMTGAKDNEFFQGSVFAQNGSTPDTGVSSPAAWLDLSREPVILHLPARRSAQLIDAWTNVFASPSASEADDFIIAGPSWCGDTPSGMTVIASPTDMALVLVRAPWRGGAEDDQGGMSLTPLSLYGKQTGATVQESPSVTPPKPPSEQIADMGAKTFFTRFVRLLAFNPPVSADAPLITNLLSLGIVPGPEFDFDALDPAVQDMLSRSAGPAQTRILSSEPRAVTNEDLASISVSRARRALDTLVLAMPANGLCLSPEVPLHSAEVSDQAESEDELSVENGILFKAGGRKSAEAGFDIREDIARGQEFLRDKIAGCTETRVEKRVTLSKRGRKRERLVVRRTVRPNFLLAVEDLKERKIRQVLITGRGCVTEGFHVTRIRANGVASRFEVTYPENMAILALRTTVRSGNGLKEVVYSPYSPEIDTPEVRKAGLDYLMGRIKLARSDLAAKRVRLAEFDTGDGTPMEVSLVLSIIEHIDPARFERYKSNEIALVHEVLTIIGANTTQAYRYSRSPAGARGLFQFIPGTYRMILAQYRNAGLTRDFVSGCDDHVNAAKASLLLFNSDLASLPERLWFAARNDSQSLGMFIAAAYNCGPKRVEKSARACKGSWTCRLPEETRIYLEKFNAVWRVRDALDK